MLREMPRSIHTYNASNDRCDMLAGPCACGAWHSLDEWRGRMQRQTFRTENDLRQVYEALREAGVPGF